MHTNGTYHAEAAHRSALRRTRALIAGGALLAVVGLINVLVVNADMTALEQSGPERLALAGGGLDRFVPSLLANLPRPQTLGNAGGGGGGAVAGDPRRSPQYIADKRALERWVALVGIGLEILFVGLESRIPDTTAHPRSPTGTDLSRLLILVSLLYAGLSIFER